MKFPPRRPATAVTPPILCNPSSEQSIKTKATFYHAGCPVCVAAEQNLAAALDPARFDVETVHFRHDRRRISEAESYGVKSVPALVIGRQTYHINFGAALDALRQ